MGRPRILDYILAASGPGIHSSALLFPLFFVGSLLSIYETTYPPQQLDLRKNTTKKPKKIGEFGNPCVEIRAREGEKQWAKSLPCLALLWLEFLFVSPYLLVPHPRR